MFFIHGIISLCPSIYLLRHCKVQNPDNLLYGRLPGFPLSEQGIEEIKQASQFLKNKNITAIYSSPLERTIQTTKIVKETLSLSYIIDERLTEINPGKWAGRSKQEFFKQSNYCYQPYSGEDYETYQSVAKRFIEFTKKITQDNILVVSHSDTILLGILALANEPASNLRSLTLPTGGIIQLDLAPIVHYQLVYPPVAGNDDSTCK
ncbi:MAG: histidine phosphatase family protein [bacterium]